MCRLDSWDKEDRLWDQSLSLDLGLWLLDL